LSTYVLEWLTIGRADCAVVYTVPTSSGVELAPVLNEQLYLVSSSGSGSSPRDDSVHAEISLEEVAARNLVMPSRPHSIRMLVEATMAQASLKPRIALEIESIPAILTLVRDEGVHAILSLKAVRSSGRESDFHVRPIRRPTLQTTLWIATSAQRPRGPLLNQFIPLLQHLLRDHWAAGV
jgi:LysR family nitrogen assimilation transcriptional regulator